MTLERKYGDSLSMYDLTGQKPKKHRKKRQVDGITDNGASEAMSFTETRTVQTAPTQEDSLTVRSHA